MRYGGFWIRAWAAILDGFFVFLVSLPTLLLDEGYEALVQLVIFFFYETLLTSGEKQGTWGKQLLGLKVSNIDGSRISYQKSVGRYFGKWLSSLTLFIGYIMIAFSDRKQGLHDRLADSLVLIDELSKQNNIDKHPLDAGLSSQHVNFVASSSSGGWVIAGFDESGHVLRFHFQLSDGRLTSSSGLRIGRSEKENDFVIPDTSISRIHARFVVSGNELFLEDLGSRNGTYIGNRRIEPNCCHRVYGDQEVQFGNVVFSVGRE